mgnify:CR=1 FL=1
MTTTTQTRNVLTYEERVTKALKGFCKFDPCFADYIAEYATPDRKVRFSLSLRAKDRKMALRLANAEKYAADHPAQAELIGLFKIRRR